MTVAQVQQPSSLQVSDQHGSSTIAPVTCTSDATTAFTWGAWVEVDASLSADICAVTWAASATTSAAATNSSMLLQVGTGSAGAETAWATALVGYAVVAGSTPPVTFPGKIASGTRVAVRTMGARINKACTGRYLLWPAKSGAALATTPVSIGHSESNAQGVALPAGGSVNTKTAWTEITASTSAAIAVLNIQVQGNGDTVMHSSLGFLDIGTGAAGSETVLLSNLVISASSAELWIPLQPMTYGVDIPSGTRIAARWQFANTANSVDVAITAVAGA